MTDYDFWLERVGAAVMALRGHGRLELFPGEAEGDVAKALAHLAHAKDHLEALRKQEGSQ